MAKFTQRIKFRNKQETFATLWLEPWGEDYGMMPDDEFEIIAENVDSTFYFYIDYEDEGVQVYAEGDGEVYPGIFQNGERLFCGHNRRE